MHRSISAFLLVALPLLSAGKRPLNQNDYDSWRHIQNQVLSGDGRFLAYALFPQEGDGELVIRNLGSGKEFRQPIGELPPPPRPNYSSPQIEEAPPLPPGIAVKFTADGRFLIASTFPTHAAVEESKRRALKGRDGNNTGRSDSKHNASGAKPEGDLIILNLGSGALVRFARVRDFELPTQTSEYVAYLQTAEHANAKDDGPVSGTTPAASKTGRSKVETGTLILRHLSDGREQSFAQVSEYSFTRDGKTLIYAVAAPHSGGDGVFALTPAPAAQSHALASGEGSYSKLTWDEDQSRLAFLTDRDDVATRKPHYSLYSWSLRSSAPAEKLVSDSTPGMQAGWTISRRANLVISKGGERIFFGTAPLPPPAKPLNKDTPDDERVSVDLWSWNDDYIQPMQKIRAATERFRSYRAVYDLSSKRFTQLADKTMNEVLPSADGRYGIGEDNRAYRRLQEYDGNYTDSYLVDISTGEHKLLAKKHLNHLTWSPDSSHMIFFNGKDWLSFSTATGKGVNLTSKLPVSFANEQNDVPGMPDSYRLAGWTADGRSVLIYDRYDIWRFDPDGASAVDLTEGLGRKTRVQFRLVRFFSDDPKSRWINPANPLLLRAESEQNHATGFYRAAFAGDSAPQQLVFEDKNFAPPIRAEHADVLVTAASTFSEYPDLLVTDSSFHHFQRVTDANPQMAGLLWGSAELVHFNSADGIPLQATLYKPENFDPTKKYPLLVYIYERLTQNVNNFIEPRPYNTINPSVYVSNGYLVLEPDIVYKVGYPGQSALNCVLPAIQSVANQGFVNENAIGIQGHSWGGYQIAYMITRTNRFRAASAGAPVADMISAYDGIRWGPGIPRQFQYERTQSRIGGNVWEYPMRYIENSPIFAADRVNTPLLMIHNDADDAVPWYQGIEYYLALRRLNKQVYLFTYNGEPHNLRRRANQKDYALRLQQFFGYYLKGEAEPDWMKHGILYLDKPGVASALDGDDAQ